ncbi:MAG: toll/interleukin-1 receptor domain-containing protein [Myxococcales bacterium]|nr:toll/interleukin-1 receptor domain-containing protein [Myxococcales bacterium]
MKTSSKYALPSQVETLLGSAARYFEGGGRRELVALLANSRVEVEEAVDYDNWNGGQTGHGIRLRAPEQLFHTALSDAEQHGADIRELMNKLSPVSHEHIAWVEVVPDLTGVSPNWRFETGALLSPPTLAVTSEADQERLWGARSPRVFLSHRADWKVQATDLRDALAGFGAGAFVAHVDIEPSRAWQAEIERALLTMDVLVAMVTEGFKTSPWTNQEVGVAIGRGVPVVSLRLDEDPPGFIGAVQAVNGRGRKANEWATGLIEAFTVDARLSRQVAQGLVVQWESATSFMEGIQAMDRLDACKSIPSDLLDRIEAAYRANNQLHGSGVVNRKYPAFIDRMKEPGK